LVLDVGKKGKEELTPKKFIQKTYFLLMWFCIFENLKNLNMKIVKISFVLLVLLQLTGCAELQEVVNSLPQEGLSNEQIAGGLKQALNKGIDKEVTKLMAPDGFYKDQMVKILLPEDLQKVDQTLRDIGLGQLADEGLKLLCR